MSVPRAGGSQGDQGPCGWLRLAASLLILLSASPALSAGAEAADLPQLIDPPTAPEALKAAWQPAANTPPDAAALEVRIFQGESSTRVLKALQQLSRKYHKNDELPFLLGQLYLSKLWVGDGLKAFRNAIQLNPEYRSNPFLIRAAISGLGNDSDHAQVQRFLAQDIGRPAVPYLEEVLFGDWRAQVKERASAVLREVQ